VFLEFTGFSSHFFIVFLGNDYFSLVNTMIGPGVYNNPSFQVHGWGWRCGVEKQNNSHQGDVLKINRRLLLPGGVLLQQANSNSVHEPAN
jgi:hypothetical protein